MVCILIEEMMSQVLQRVISLIPASPESHIVLIFQVRQMHSFWLMEENSFLFLSLIFSLKMLLPQKLYEQRGKIHFYLR